jgi:hypothetical protein
MATFSAQIVSLVGGSPTQSELDVWCIEGAKEIIRQLPLELQKKCATMQSFTSVSAGSESETLGEGNVLSVFAGSASCRMITNTDKYKAEDSGNVLYATSSDPAYYFEADKINVLPSSLSCKYEEVQYPTVNADSDSSISNFPDEAEHLVVLYASMKQLLQYQLDQHSSLPTLTLPVAPAPPSLSAQTVTISGTAPTFTAPVVSPDFSQVNTYIDTNEDVELASAKLQEISIQLNEYANNIQKEQAEFNEENVEYQSKLQKDVADAQFSDANEARKLAKYQAEVSTYSANLNANVQDFTTKLQKFTTKYQWYGDQYTKLSAEYIRGLAAIKGT